jgi:hypothetical protein
MPMTGSGRRMCRHEPPQACTRWWCGHKYGLFVVLGFAVLIAVIVVFLNHGHVLPPTNLNPNQSSTTCPLC